MDQVEEMMEGLAIDDQSSSSSSSFYWYVDLDYEFDAFQFFDFAVEETDFDVEEAERWFRYARDYPPAPYMMKINLNNVLKNTSAQVNKITSLKQESVEPTTPTTSTISDCGIDSSEGRTKDGSDMKLHNLLADIQNFRDRFKSARILTKPTSTPTPKTTFMKPTASHLAKKINTTDCGRSPKLQTPTGSETEDTKRQKLDIGFLRKVSQLQHQTSFSHKTTPKTTIPQTFKLMTEERARWRRSQSKVEPKNHMFKALPLNRKILESPSLPSHKKSVTFSSDFQKFHFKYDN